MFGSAHSGEGHDRKDLLFNKPGLLGSWPSIEDLIMAVSSAQPKTVVVAIAPGAILTDWRDKVPAILCVFLPGEQFGNALADVVFGKIAPQAKLPLTFPNIENEQKMTPQQWPGVPSTKFPGSKHVVYSEGQINGYRWYDKHAVVPAFPFGHGLSYGGNASFSNLAVAERTVSFEVGVPQQGCETAQVYLSYPGASASASTPTKVLRGYEKICGGEGKKTVKLALSDRDVSTWDVAAKAWKVVKGDFKVHVGSSSQDIRLEGIMRVS